ncbi:MAG TPA: hypothetical protein VJM31_13840 [Vicinamibacterales bacterium]|nr:hypothetical protein [Vicinamibacterales bacterium]
MARSAVVLHYLDANEMTTHGSCADARSEQGAALVMAIISLFLITGLATAMLTSARTESLIATNEERAVLARMAAEAGLNHGVQVVAERLALWQTVPFATTQLAVTDLLNGPDNDSATTADNGILSEYGLNAANATTTLNATEGTRYEVRAYDDDDAAARGITLSSVDLTRIGEQNPATSTTPYTDLNSRIVVQSIGYGPAGTSTRFEAMLGTVQMPAVVSNGDLNFNGNVTLAGAQGGAHSNSDLDIDGNSFSATQNCTASGAATGNLTNCAGGTNGSSFPTLTVPNVLPTDYLDEARYRLNAGGTVEMRSAPAGAFAACTGTCLTGLNWTFGGGTWTLNGTPPTGGYFVEGNVDIAGSATGVSIFATGSLTMSGNRNLAPPALLSSGNIWATTAFLVLNGDLSVSGTPNLGTSALPGLILIREQISMSGNVTVFGQLLMQDASNISNTVGTNDISGSVNITYTGAGGLSAFTILSWREVR